MLVLRTVMILDKIMPKEFDLMTILEDMKIYVQIIGYYLQNNIC